MRPYQPPKADCRKRDRWNEEIKRGEKETDWEIIVVILVVLTALVFSPVIIEFMFLFFSNLFES